MKNQKQLFIILLVISILAGCNLGNTDQNNGVQELFKQNTKVEEPVMEKEPEAIAKETVENYVKGINESNIESMIESMLPDSQNYYSQERATAALEDYKKLLGNEIDYDWIPPQNKEEIKKVFTFRLYGNNKENLIEVFVDKEIGYVRRDIYLNYSYFVHDHINGFIEALKTKNREELSNALSVDILYFPIEYTDQVIAKYGEEFDLTTLDYQLIGVDLQYSAGKFLYVITGSKNGTLKEHPIKVGCGDGETGIEDEWVPPDREMI